jgi:hypothetical protein
VSLQWSTTPTNANNTSKLKAAPTLRGSSASTTDIFLPSMSACLMKMRLPGTIDASELGAALKAMGHNLPDEEIKKMILQVPYSR